MTDFYGPLPIRFLDALRAREIDALQWWLGTYLVAVCYERRNTSRDGVVVTLDELAGFLDLSGAIAPTKETIRRRLHSLAEEGWIEVDTKRGPGGVWRVRLADLGRQDQQPPSSDFHRVSTEEGSREWKSISSENSTGDPLKGGVNPHGESDTAPPEFPLGIPLDAESGSDRRDETRRDKRKAGLEDYTEVVCGVRGGDPVTEGMLGALAAIENQHRRDHDEVAENDSKPNPALPLLGDPDYLDLLEAAFKNGNVTEAERRETRRVHLACFRTRPPDEAALLTEVNGLLVEGVLIERPGPLERGEP